jgi:hypothetical protein
LGWRNPTQIGLKWGKEESYQNMHFLGPTDWRRSTACIPIPLIYLKNQGRNLRGCIEIKLYADCAFDLKYYHMGSSDMGHLHLNPCYSPTTNSRGSSPLGRLIRRLRLEYQDTQACVRSDTKTLQRLKSSNLYCGF